MITSFGGMDAMVLDPALLMLFGLIFMATVAVETAADTAVKAPAMRGSSASA